MELLSPREVIWVCLWWSIEWMVIWILSVRDIVASLLRGGNKVKDGFGGF